MNDKWQMGVSVTWRISIESKYCTSKTRNGIAAVAAEEPGVVKFCLSIQQKGIKNEKEDQPLHNFSFLQTALAFPPRVEERPVCFS